MAKSKRVEVRVSEETLDAWERAAAERGVALSELVRFAVNDEVGRLAILNSDDGRARHPAREVPDPSARRSALELRRDEVTPLFRDERKGKL